PRRVGSAAVTLTIFDLPMLVPQGTPPLDLPLAVAGAAIAPQAGTPLIVPAGEVPAALTATLVSYPDRTPIAELPLVDLTFEDVASGYGSAIVKIEADDPAVALLDEGQLIEHRLY